MGSIFDHRPSSVELQTLGDASRKKEHRQLFRVKQLFAHRTQRIKDVYGQSVDLGHVSPYVLDVERGEKKQKQQQISTDEIPLLLSEEQLSIAAGQFPATFGRHPAVAGHHPGGAGGQPPHSEGEPPGTSKDELHGEAFSPERTAAQTVSGAGKQDLHKLMAEKKALSEELRFAQGTAEQVNQMVLKNSQLKEEKQEIEAMKETLAAAMFDFTSMKESLVSNHRDTEKKCMDLVSPEVKEEKERVNRNIDGLRDFLTTMGCDEKRLRVGFQDQFKALAVEFQYVRKEIEVNDRLLQERRQQFREYQELARSFHTLAQRINHMEKTSRAIRNQIQQVQVSLVAIQKALAEATEEKDKLQCDRNSTEAEWMAEQQVWGIEKRAMEEDFRNHMGTKDMERMEEREELFSQKKAMTADLFVARNRAEDLDDELTYMKTLTEGERAALTDAETTLENSEEDNAALKDLYAKNVQSIIDFRKNNKAKAEELRKLRKVVKGDIAGSSLKEEEMARQREEKRKKSSKKSAQKSLTLQKLVLEKSKLPGESQNLDESQKLDESQNLDEPQKALPRLAEGE